MIDQTKRLEQIAKLMMQQTCPYAKSDMTPCYIKDGKVVEVFISGKPSCVGCEHSFEYIKINMIGGKDAGHMKENP
jgi:hypothetical protein